MIIARMLGSGSGMPSIDKSHSALWCNVNKLNILFDCGEGTAQKLLEFDLDGEVLDSIVISHNHPDHLTGIFMVIQMLHLQKRTKPLTIYLPERIGEFAETLNLLYLFPEKLSFLLSLKDNEDLPEEISEITPIKNDHLLTYQDFITERDLSNPMISYSFLIETGYKTILFTSDINRTDHLNEFMGAAKIVIIDALHPSPEDIFNIIDLQDKEVILVHGISEDLKTMMRANDRENFIIAGDGQPIYA